MVARRGAEPTKKLGGHSHDMATVWRHNRKNRLHIFSAACSEWLVCLYRLIALQIVVWGLASCHRHTQPQLMRPPSAKTGGQLATRQRCGLFHHHALLSSFCRLHNSPWLSAKGHHRKASLILSMRLVRVVTSVPVCATTPTAREHFVPLRPNSHVHAGTPLAHSMAIETG